MVKIITMGHGHHHHHHHSHGSNGHIATAFFLNLGFTIIEFIGGIYTNSVAIQSDALHDAGDTMALGAAWYFQRLSKKEGNAQFTFGYKRFNTLGAIFTGMVLLIGSCYILTEAIPRLFNPEEASAEGMIVLAILGVIVNGIAVVRMKQGGDSLNEKMMTWHLLEDVLGWAAVLVGAILMYFFDLLWIDPILSIGITLFILKGVMTNLWSAGKIILQATPEDIDMDKLITMIESVEGVNQAHHLHVWTMDGEYNLLSAHIETDGNRKVFDLQPIKKTIYEVLGQHFHIDHITLEFETVGECSSEAMFCK